MREAYITSGPVMFLSTLIAGRIGCTEPVVVSSICNCGRSSVSVVLQPAMPSSARAPAPESMARRES
ncbi:hypothetical protein [Mesorhizobium sp. M1E.F.Ca.ET.041.01.1.1]|uniref:hypothetical protein n=1 Tax=Mesorhizobium sp. M1E.F.Ca.ET.041.01.1.1 TaxID=2496759 RepID=UPI001FDEACC6|nr:hypothetical protein [Mesorhizobium sp. M1E.F.Ca.ET.041.01.1.1]